MSDSRDQQRAFGGMSVVAPPIVFGTSALGNVGRVIAEPAKVAICGEWFQKTIPPVFIHTAYRYGNGMALEVLGRTLRRLDVPADEVVIQLAIEGAQFFPVSGRSGPVPARECWEKSCRLLGDAYRPKLISVDGADTEAWQAAAELKAAGNVQGVGIVVSDWHDALDRVATSRPAWITLSGGCTVMRHLPEALAFMSDMAARQIPLVVASVFDGGFLVGGTRLDGHIVNSDDPANRSLFAWRKAFVALCDGHGISPAHACIQFALSLPGVVAVLLDSSYADRVAANINAAYTKVPENFWASMKEEGLLEADSPVLGI